MGNCLTHLDFGTEELLQILGFSSISPIQTRWISGVLEADLSEQILRILGFPSNSAIGQDGNLESWSLRSTFLKVIPENLWFF